MSKEERRDKIVALVHEMRATGMALEGSALLGGVFGSDGIVTVFFVEEDGDTVAAHDLSPDSAEIFANNIREVAALARVAKKDVQ